jgi:hypothetical protein
MSRMLALRTDMAQQARKSIHGHATVIGRVAEYEEKELQEGSLVQYILKIPGKHTASTTSDSATKQCSSSVAVACCQLKAWLVLVSAEVTALRCLRAVCSAALVLAAGPDYRRSAAVCC